MNRKQRRTAAKIDKKQGKNGRGNIRRRQRRRKRRSPPRKRAPSPTPSAR